MKIAFVSHSFYGPYFVVGSHHLARQLARRGHSVWHISAIPWFHLLNVSRSDYSVRMHRFFQGIIQQEANLKEAVIRPLLPWQMTRGLLNYGNLFLDLSDIRWLVRMHPDLRDIDVLIIDEPRLNGIEKYIHAKSIYYRPTDLYVDAKNDSRIQDAEAALLAGCQGLVATSAPVLERMLTLRQEIPNLLLTNGVDYDAFTSPRDEPDALRRIGRPRVVYVGAIDDRFDIGAIRFLAARFPKVNFVIIGDGSHFEDVQGLAGDNIHVLGLVPYAELNSYLQYCDVGILPLVKSRSNEGRSPLKLYEFGMSGLPVLASRTPELGRRTEAFIELYSDYEEAAETLRRILSQTHDRSQIVGQCMDHTWSNKAAILESFITSTQAS